MQQTLIPPIGVANFLGNYASSLLMNTTQGLETLTGQIISDGIANLAAGTSGSGTLDVNSFNTTNVPPGKPSLNATLATGSFTADPSGNGRFPLKLNIQPAAGQPPLQVPSINPVCYILDANTCLLLGLEPTAPGTGILQLQRPGI